MLHARTDMGQVARVRDDAISLLERSAPLFTWAAITMSERRGVADSVEHTLDSAGRRLHRACRREQDGVQLPDVFGWQLLRSRHLEAAHDLSRWTVSPLGGDHFQ